MNEKAIYNLSYGLFVLTAKSEKQNGCIINTAIQAASEPNQLSVCVNKQNYTSQMISKEKKFNVSVVAEDADFELFKHFGFQSGKDTDKFNGFNDFKVAPNGINYITKGTNAYFSCTVTKEIDLGSHLMFIAVIDDADVLSKLPSMTYAYYFANVKPKPQKVESTENVWVCKICGYVYDNAKEKVKFEDLPDDWTCPLCKHPKSDFELRN